MKKKPAKKTRRMVTVDAAELAALRNLYKVVQRVVKKVKKRGTMSVSR